MREHIHTIPVTDALREAQGRCPFCLMREKLEREAVGFIMGPAYMEDDVRMETNTLGFCADHLRKLYGEQNRLGLALMLHTFTQRLNKDLTAAAKESPLPRLGKKAKGGPAERLRGALQASQETCYLCDRINATFARYMDTYLYLWRQGGEEAKAIEGVAGYCLPHFAGLLTASESLGGKRDGFLAKAIPAQLSYMHALEDDLEWFTLKFDYRNADAPWKNAKDALPRAMAALRQAL